MSIFNRGDHDDGMRLRILVNNTCDKDCNYCLNDFQDKTIEKQLSIHRAFEAIKVYSQYCYEKHLHPIVTFSGGEPGLWRHLKVACIYAKNLGCIVKVCTNGKAFESKAESYVDRWHVHIFSHLFKLPEYARPDNTVLQYVVTDRATDGDINSMIWYADTYPLKFFVDYYSKKREALSEGLESSPIRLDSSISCIHISLIMNLTYPVCLWCKKDCVTLKGIWLFPSGEASTCPQGQLTAVSVMPNEVIDSSFVEKCHIGHKITNLSSQKKLIKRETQ